MSQIKVRRIDYYPDEFLVGTASMDSELVGAYWRLCSLIYSRGGPVKDDAEDLCHRLRCRPSSWAKLRQSLIDSGKIIVADGTLSNVRTEIELRKVEERTESLRKFGKKGGRLRANLAEETAENSQSEKAEGLSAEKLTTTTTSTTTISSLRSDPPIGLPPKPAEPEKPEDPRDPEDPVDPLRQQARDRARTERLGSRLTSDFSMPDEWRAWALNEGHAPHVVALEAAKFLDYWIGKPGKDGRKADWQATWRNWMRKATQNGGPNGQQRHPPQRGGNPFDRAYAQSRGGAAADAGADAPLFGIARHGNDRAVGPTIDGECIPAAGD